MYSLRERWGDVTFQLDTGEKVKASRIVLVANCEHFNNMFSGDFIESTAEFIKIHDVSVEAFQYLIKYCYYGAELFNGEEGDMAREVQTSNELTTVFEFMKLCDRYNLPHVAEKTSRLVISKMTDRGPDVALYILAETILRIIQICI